MLASFVSCTLDAGSALSCTALDAGLGTSCVDPNCMGTMALETNGSPGGGGSVIPRGPKLTGTLGTLDKFWDVDAGWPALELTGAFGTTGVSLGDKPVGCLDGVFVGVAGFSMGLDAKGLLLYPQTSQTQFQLSWGTQELEYDG